jgi:Flp pilus assembly pilin Flp
MVKRRRGNSGQAMTEYIIIVVIVAIAALVIVGLFSDTVRSKFGGAVEEMGGDESAVSDALDEESLQYLKDLEGGDGGN